MKVIIAGSRNLHGLDLVDRAVKLSGFEVSEVVCGKAPGIDRDGESWAKFRGIPVKYFVAQWQDLSHFDKVVRINAKGEKYDARAGGRRNLRMGAYADALIAIWDGKSPGTKDMIRIAKKKDVKLFVLRTDRPIEQPQNKLAIKVVRNGEVIASKPLKT